MIDYEKELIEQNIRNQKEFIKNTCNGKMPPKDNEKIINWGKRKGWSNEETNNIKKEYLKTIKKENKTDSDKVLINLFVSVFQKDSIKQNIPEKVFLKYFLEMPEIKKMYKPKNLYYVNGEKKYLKKRRNKNIKVKSVDFIIELINNININIFHKRTKEGGGGQDNQENDVREWIENAIPANKDTIFIAVCDDLYFDEETIKNLKKLETDNVKIMNSDELKKHIEELCNKN